MSDSTKPFFDPESPFSLTNLLPAKEARLIEELVGKTTCCHEFLLDEPALKHHMYSCHSFRPSVADNRIRYAFWNEYEEACSQHRVMDVSKIFKFVMDEGSFKQMFLKVHPQRTMWMIVRPAHYEYALKEMLLHGVTRMREILDMPVITAKGEINMKMLDLQVKITNMIDYRLHGAPKQDIRQLSVNINKDMKGEAGEDISSLVNKGDMKAIQSRLNAIKSEKEKLEGRMLESKPQEHEVLEALPVERAEPKS